MDTVKSKFGRKKAEKTQKPEDFSTEQAKKVEEKPYNEIISWVEKSVKDLKKIKNKLYLFENDEQKAVISITVSKMKQYFHLFPAWKKAGVIEFNGEDFDKSV